MSNEWPLDPKKFSMNSSDTISDLPALNDNSETLVDVPRFDMRTSLPTSESLSVFARNKAMYVTDDDGAYNYRPEGPQPGDVVFMPKLKSLTPSEIQEQTRSAAASIEKTNNGSRTLLYLLSIALASGALFKYLNPSLVDNQQQSPAIIYTPEQENKQNDKSK